MTERVKAKNKPYRYWPKLDLLADVGRSLGSAEGIGRTLGHMIFTKRSEKLSTTKPTSVKHQDFKADVEIKVSLSQAPDDEIDKRGWVQKIRDEYEGRGYKSSLYYQNAAGMMISGRLHHEVEGAIDLLIQAGRISARFGVATVHGILTNRVYIGEWVFNRRCSKTLAEKPKAEQIPITVLAIIALAEFEAMQPTLASLWALRAEKSAQVDGRVAALRSEVTGAEEKLTRRYRMVEEGVTDLNEILKCRFAAPKEVWDRVKAALDRIHVAERFQAEIAPELIEQFGRLMRENVTAGEIPFRKTWLQATVDRVEVSADIIRIIGDKASLAAAITSQSSSAVPSVRSSV